MDRRCIKSILLLGICTRLCIAGVCAQGVNAGAHVILPPEAALHIGGDLNIHEAADLRGLVTLTGSLTDHAGLSPGEGELRFAGQGDEQLIGGPALTSLHHMTIDPAAKVRVAAGKWLTVTGELTNLHPDDGLTLASGDAGTASLIHGSPSVYAAIERSFPDVNNSWHYLSSPVVAQAIEPEFYAGGNDSFMAWYEPETAWVSYTNDSYYPTFMDANEGASHFLAANGYYAGYYPGLGAPLTRVFRGELHQGQQTITLSMQSGEDALYAGYQLAGNPYPSAIDWMAEEGWTGKEYLAGASDETDKTAWVWNATLGNFGVIHPPARHTGHNDTDHHIPAMQGFWIQAAAGSDGQTLAMDNRVRVHSTKAWTKNSAGAEMPDLVRNETDGEGQRHRRAEEPERKPGNGGSPGSTGEAARGVRIMLAAADASWRDEVVLELGHPAGTAAAPKLFPNNPVAPQLYLLHKETPYSILLLEAVTEAQVFSLGTKIFQRGQYILYLEGEAEDDKNIILQDRLTGDYIALSSGRRAYSFHSDQKPDGETRFSLHISP